MTNTAPQNNSISTYNQYKDTGIPWLGKIPAHWEVRKLKFLGKLYSGLSGKNSNDFSKISKDNFKPYVTFSAIYQNTIITDDDKAFEYVKLESHEQQNKVEYDDILFLMSSETIEDIAKAAIYKGEKKELYLNSFCKGFKVRSRSLNPKFLIYLINSNSFRNYFMIYARGFTRINLKQEYINNNPIFLPPKPEQTAIVHFLDRKTTQIDQAIAQKQALINRLKTYKQVLIQQAVTKGLNPDAPLKDSGVEWIGQIPAHWEVWKISHLFNYIGSGTTPPSNDEKYYNGKINFLQTGDLNDGIVNKTKKTIKKQTLKNFSALKLYPKGSLVIAMYGATIGKLGILGLDATTNQACSVLIKSKRVSNKLMFYILMAFRNEIISLSYGGGQPNISQELIKSLKFPIPPKKEQAEIVAYIEAKTTQIDHTIALQEKEIKRLQTYKTVLIDQAVTGKIKVI